jgi:hypothetical protein
VEVGEEAVHRAEAVAGRDEDVGVAFEGVDLPSSSAALSSRRSEVVPTATIRPPPRAGVEALGGGGVDAAPFAVHAVLVRVLGLDRQEGAGADMERQRLVADAGALERLHQPRREVKRGGGRGDGPLLAREHRLIISASRSSAARLPAM